MDYLEGVSPPPVRVPAPVCNDKGIEFQYLRCSTMQPVLNIALMPAVATHTTFTSTTAKVFMQTLIHRDTKPGQGQVWASFLGTVFFVRGRAVMGRSGAVPVRLELGLS